MPEDSDGNWTWFAVAIGLLLCSIVFGAAPWQLLLRGAGIKRSGLVRAASPGTRPAANAEEETVDEDPRRSPDTAAPEEQRKQLAKLHLQETGGEGKTID